MGRTTLVALGAAAVWSVALWFAAFSVPVYSGTSSSASSDGSVAVVETSQTLVGENGLAAALVMAVPFVVTLVVAAALAFVRRPTGVVLAWAATGLFAAFNLLALLSVGIFLLPVTACFLVACIAARPQPVPAEPPAGVGGVGAGG